jgi:hypothetical protein
LAGVAKSFSAAAVSKRSRAGDDCTTGSWRGGSDIVQWSREEATLVIPMFGVCWVGGCEVGRSAE